MENILVNGDLYVKKTPTVIYLLEFNEDEDLEQQPIDFSDPEFREELISILENFDSLIEEIPHNTTRRVDYKNSIGFYRINVDQYGIHLVSEELSDTALYVTGEGENRDLFTATTKTFIDYDTVEEMSKDFISLEEFLKNATPNCFVLEPTIEGINRYCVLYEYLDNYLVLGDNNRFSVVSKHHPIMEYYKVGKRLPNTCDKGEVYKAIFAQRYSKQEGLSR